MHTWHTYISNTYIHDIHTYIHDIHDIQCETDIRRRAHTDTRAAAWSKKKKKGRREEEWRCGLILSVSPCPDATTLPCLLPSFTIHSIAAKNWFVSLFRPLPLTHKQVFLSLFCSVLATGIYVMPGDMITLAKFILAMVDPQLLASLSA